MIFFKRTHIFRLFYSFSKIKYLIICDDYALVGTYIAMRTYACTYLLLVQHLLGYAAPVTDLKNHQSRTSEIRRYS